MAKIDSLSVFFPAYNEEGNIKTTVTSAKEVLEKVANKWEIIVVNDGSKDRTREIAEALAKKDKRIKVVNQANAGYGGALKTGYRNAKYPWVAFADSDGQFDFGEITKFLEYTDKADLILGYRLHRADPFMRKVFTWGWRIFPRVIFGLTIKDYSCGFWVIKKEVFDSIQPLVGEEKVTKIEMLTKAKRKGYRFAEVGVHHYPRKFGKQTGADMKVVLKSITDLIKLWQKLN
ncbi:MAG TPA: glycosyltransferase family 2 protein [Patescibacteria group bacterium]